MDWLYKFPEMNGDTLTALKKAIDSGFRDFTRSWGYTFETMLEPVKWFMLWMERLLINSPWPLVMLVFALVAWLASRSWKVTGSVVVTLLLIGFFGMWEDSMRTIAMTLVATILAILFGIPIGIGMARSNRVQSVINPVLDLM